MATDKEKSPSEDDITPAWYIKHASLIVGLGFGVAVAAGFTYVKNEHFDPPAPAVYSSEADNDVPQLEDIQPL